MIFNRYILATGPSSQHKETGHGEARSICSENFTTKKVPVSLQHLQIYRNRRKSS
jgi:hypothetical protein